MLACLRVDPPSYPTYPIHRTLLPRNLLSIIFNFIALNIVSRAESLIFDLWLLKVGNQDTWKLDYAWTKA